MRVPADPVANHVVLVGIPGAGKSTIGRAVALRTGRRYVDLDSLIERSFGKPISAVFEGDGEGAFRLVEAEMSREVASLAEPAIIAPGGGWATNDAAVAHLQPRSRIIYLRVTADEALMRMGAAVKTRPLLASGDPLGALRSVLEARSEGYERIASAVVDTDGFGVEEVVERVLAIVGPGQPG